MFPDFKEVIGRAPVQQWMSAYRDEEQWKKKFLDLRYKGSHTIDDGTLDASWEELPGKNPDLPPGYQRIPFGENAWGEKDSREYAVVRDQFLMAEATSLKFFALQELKRKNPDWRNADKDAGEEKATLADVGDDEMKHEAAAEEGGPDFSEMKGEAAAGKEASDLPWAAMEETPPSLLHLQFLYGEDLERRGKSIPETWPLAEDMIKTLGKEDHRHTLSPELLERAAKVIEHERELIRQRRVPLYHGLRGSLFWLYQTFTLMHGALDGALHGGIMPESLDGHTLFDISRLRGHQLYAMGGDGKRADTNRELWVNMSLASGLGSNYNTSTLHCWGGAVNYVEAGFEEFLQETFLLHGFSDAHLFQSVLTSVLGDSFDKGALLVLGVDEEALGSHIAPAEKYKRTLGDIASIRDLYAALYGETEEGVWGKVPEVRVALNDSFNIPMFGVLASEQPRAAMEGLLHRMHMLSADTLAAFLFQNQKPEEVVTGNLWLQRRFVTMVQAEVDPEFVPAPMTSSILHVIDYGMVDAVRTMLPTTTLTQEDLLTRAIAGGNKDVLDAVVAHFDLQDTPLENVLGAENSLMTLMRMGWQHESGQRHEISLEEWANYLKGQFSKTLKDEATVEYLIDHALKHFETTGSFALLQMASNHPTFQGHMEKRLDKLIRGMSQGGVSNVYERLAWIAEQLALKDASIDVKEICSKIFGENKDTGNNHAYRFEWLAQLGVPLHAEAEEGVPLGFFLFTELTDPTEVPLPFSAQDILDLRDLKGRNVLEFASDRVREGKLESGQRDEFLSAYATLIQDGVIKAELGTVDMYRKAFREEPGDFYASHPTNSLFEAEQIDVLESQIQRLEEIFREKRPMSSESRRLQGEKERLEKEYVEREKSVAEVEARVKTAEEEGNPSVDLEALKQQRFQASNIVSALETQSSILNLWLDSDFGEEQEAKLRPMFACVPGLPADLSVKEKLERSKALFDQKNLQAKASLAALEERYWKIMGARERLTTLRPHLEEARKQLSAYQNALRKHEEKILEHEANIQDMKAEETEIKAKIRQEWGMQLLDVEGVFTYRIKDLMAEAETQVKAWRTDLVAAVGSGGDVKSVLERAHPRKGDTDVLIYLIGQERKEEVGYYISKLLDHDKNVLGRPVNSTSYPEEFGVLSTEGAWSIGYLLLKRTWGAELYIRLHRDGIAHITHQTLEYFLEYPPEKYPGMVPYMTAEMFDAYAQEGVHARAKEALERIFFKATAEELRTLEWLPGHLKGYPELQETLLLHAPKAFLDIMHEMDSDFHKAFVPSIGLEAYLQGHDGYHPPSEPPFDAQKRLEVFEGYRV